MAHKDTTLDALKRDPVAVAELRKLAEQGATEAQVVELARDPAHPLHPYFEWDVEKAAKRWRLAVAQERLFEFEEDMGRKPRTLEEMHEWFAKQPPERLKKPRPEALELDEEE